MYIIYFRDKNNHIVNHVRANVEETKEQVIAAAWKWNENYAEKLKRTAYVAEFADDGLAAYLLEKAEWNQAYARDSIKQAVGAIQEALECVQNLEVAKK